MSKSTIIKSIAPLLWEDTEKQPTLKICNYSFLNLREWNYPKNFGQYWRLYWNQGKGGRILYKGEIYPMTANEVFLIPSHIATATELDCEVAHFSVNFKIGGRFENVRRQIYIMKPDFLKKSLKHFAELNDEVLRLMAIQCIVTHYLSLISQEHFLASERDNLDPRIAQAVAIMESELATPPSIHDLCRRVKMSKNNFHRLFIQETCKTPRYFLFELRMLRAAWLLCYTEKSMDEIALETGYADRYHFSKSFKRFSGLPPCRFRLEKQKQ
jgi:AraC-like DNA-binding protein